jgi:hypothetical protein
MRQRVQRALILAVCLVGLPSVTLAAGASSTARPLITQPIQDGHRVTLDGNTRPEARNAAYDRGPVANNFPMAHLWLQLKRSPEQEQALVTLIDQMHDPKSPHYHQWLTAKEFGATFGLAQSDLTKISGWLQGHGFKVDAVFTNGMVIEFSGTAADVRQAFHTDIHRLDVDGELHYANMSDPQIPAALAAAVVGVVSMNDFKPHSGATPPSKYYVSSTGELTERNPDGGSGVHSDYTSGTNYTLVPADAQTIYNLAPIYAAGYSGQGQTIAVIEDSDDYSNADFTSFRSEFGLNATYPSGNLTTLLPQGSATCTDPGTTTDDLEVELDAEMATAIAPSATVEIAACATTNNWGGLIAIQNMINSTSYPPVMSMSYGECEVVSGSTQNAAFASTFQQAAAQGVSVFASAGDNSAADCEESLDPATQKDASHGINVTGWGESAYNVDVGGTDFQDTSLGKNSTYWNSTNGSTYGSAKSYIPEIPWDSSCASSVLWQFYDVGGSALAYCNSTAGENLLGAVGGGGGASSCFSGTAVTSGIGGTNGTCAPLAKPSWQAGVFGIPSDGVRDLPDVSLFAANGVWNHIWTFCFTDPKNTGKSCAGAPSTWQGSGGTSASTPVLAAIQLLIDQKYGLQGNPNYVYYALAAVEYGASGSTACNSSATGGPASTCIFYDITVGDNDVNCLGTNNCFLPNGQTNGLLSSSDSAYVDTYASGVGYDLTTGIGSVNAGNLFSKWGSVVTGQKIGTTLALSVSAEPVPQDSTETLIAKLAYGSGSAPTGAVEYVIDSDTPGTMTCTGTTSPLNCTATIETDLTVGNHNYTANYAGSADNWPSTATVVFEVTASTMPPPPPATSLVVVDEYNNALAGAPTALMQASDGNYYTTTAGSPSSLLKLMGGKFTPSTVYTFNLDTQGGAESGVVEGPSGLLYGFTSYTGDGGGAVFYSLSTSGTFKAIHAFTQTQVYVVQAQPILGSDGNFYVLSRLGGVNGQGSIMQVSPTGTYSLLYSFSDNEMPYAGLVEASPGVFYGSTYQGGASIYGYIFKMVVTGSSATVTDIHDFDGTDGEGAASTLIVGANGNLYGMTSQGGTANPGCNEGTPCGTIFEVSPSGTLTTLVEFATYESEVGSLPNNGFLLASDGNFYGDEGEEPGAGGNYQATAWAMTPSGTFTVPTNPDGSETGNMVGASYPMIQANDGTIMQTSGEGGSSETGDVVKMTLSPALVGPVQVTTSGTYQANTAFTLNYAVLNGYSTTYQQCYGYVQGGTAGAGTFTGKLSNGTAQITPTANGTYTYAVTCGGIESGFVTVVVGFAVTTTQLPTGTVGYAYTATLQATDGTAPYTWSVSSGTLPAGLTLAANTGIISGTPTKSATSSFTIGVTDSASHSATQAESIVVYGSTIVRITTTTLPNGAVGTAYTTTLAATSGTKPYTWSIAQGSLPAGLSLAASTGVISGTPTAAGTQTFLIAVKGTGAYTATAQLSITVIPALTIDTTLLPTAGVGASYSFTLTASYGTSPYTWSVSSGTLPAGLMLSASTGVISGKPTTATAADDFTIEVADSASHTATQAVVMVVYGSTIVRITTTSLPNGTVGTAYTATLAATSGTKPYTWSVYEGELPAGLTLAASTGVISGTPTAAGTTDFFIGVKGAGANTATAALSITIAQ